MPSKLRVAGISLPASPSRRAKYMDPEEAVAAASWDGTRGQAVSLWIEQRERVRGGRMQNGTMDLILAAALVLSGCVGEADRDDDHSGGDDDVTGDDDSSAADDDSADDDSTPDFGFPEGLPDCDPERTRPCPGRGAARGTG